MTFIESLARLTRWSDDELHQLRSVRMFEPVYRNPAELRADVRALIAEHENVCEILRRKEALDEITRLGEEMEGGYR